MEESEVHGAESRRRLRRAGDQRDEVRTLRRTRAVLRRGTRADRHSSRRSIPLPRKHEKDHRRTLPSRVLHWGSCPGCPGSCGCAGTETPVFAAGEGSRPAAQAALISLREQKMATDIGDLVSQGTEFAKTLEGAKQRVHSPRFEWYRYDSIANLSHLD